MILHNLDLLVNQALNVSQVSTLGLITKSDREPALPCAPRSSNAMYVALWLVREVKVKDVTHTRDVNPSRGDVCSDEGR
jgi:hypothetical protein